MNAVISKCAACGKKVEPGTTRCPACNAPNEIPSPDERAALLRRTGVFVSIDDVLDAIETYLKRWPDAPECRDVRLANQCLLLQLMLVQLAVHRKLSGRGSADVELLGALCEDGLPPRLANGLLPSARVKDPDKRARTVDWITRAANVCAAGVLGPLYDAAAQERQDLLVDGRAQYEVKKISRETCMRDFKVHFTSFERGDLATACDGMQHLKQLNPDEPLFRWGLGTVLLKDGKPLAALQEALYGFSLAPNDSGWAALLLQCLCTVALYPAAVEVARHHENLRAKRAAQAAEINDAMARTARGFAMLARAVTTASAAFTIGCGQDDCSNDAPEVVEDVALVPRPWLTEPPETNQVANPMSTARVFISYRHRRGRNFAQRIEGSLKAAYPSMRVFRDETWLGAGDDFVNTLSHEIDTADVFLALVDDDWASRFADPTDVLHREVGRAIEHDRRIIPALLEDAPMPAEQSLPPDIASFARLHAPRLTQARFDEEMQGLESEMTNAVIADERHRQLVYGEIDKIIELKSKDPAAADKIIRRIADTVPKFVPRKAAQGEGVPRENVEMAGDWECSANLVGSWMKLRFTLRARDAHTFRGEWWVQGTGLLSLLKLKRAPIDGTWMEVMDTDQDLLLGLVLDGLKAGEPFRLEIPIQRRLGDGFVGTDRNGIVYQSKIVQVRREGL